MKQHNAVVIGLEQFSLYLHPSFWPPKIPTQRNRHRPIGAAHGFSNERTLPLDGRANNVRAVSNAICAASATVDSV